MEFFAEKDGILLVKPVVLQAFYKRSRWWFYKRSRWLPYDDTVFNGALNPVVLPTVYCHETIAISYGSRDG